MLFQDEVVDLKGCSEADTCNYLNGIGHDDKEQKRLETLIQKLGYKDWEVGKAELGWVACTLVQHLLSLIFRR